MRTSIRLTRSWYATTLPCPRNRLDTGARGVGFYRATLLGIVNMTPKLELLMIAGVASAILL